MKCHTLAAIVSPLLLMGCASTQVVEVSQRQDEGIASINARAEYERATVLMLNSEVSVQARKSLVVSDDSARYVVDGSDLITTVPLANIREIGVSESGVGRGVLYGGLAGGAGFGLAMLGSKDGWFTGEAKFTIGFLVGAPLGALIGGLIGGATGSETVIYRFRRDTPNQISVVIGAGQAPPQAGKGYVESR